MHYACMCELRGWSDRVYVHRHSTSRRIITARLASAGARSDFFFFFFYTFWGETLLFEEVFTLCGFFFRRAILMCGPLNNVRAVFDFVIRLIFSVFSITLNVSIVR